MKLLYRPKHPKANKNGMVEARFVEGMECGSAPYVISDTMDPTRHMVNNRMYTSKAKFRQATRDAGCIEIGSETAHMLKPRKPVMMDRGKRRDDIRRSIYDIRNGRV